MKVSIIVPVYNAETTLHRCINSILNQTYSDLEVLLINDGSTDFSGIICDSYAETDARVVVMHQLNSGSAAARNAGIRAATGDFIQFVDADDWLEEEMTALLVQAMTPEHQLVICGYQMLDETKQPIRSKKILPAIRGSMDMPQFLNHIVQLYRNFLLASPCNKLYCTQTMKRQQTFFMESIRHGEDLIFNLEYLLGNPRIQFIRQAPYHYMIGAQSPLVKKFHRQSARDQQFMFNELKEFLKLHACYSDTNKKQLDRLYTNSILHALNELFHPDTAMPAAHQQEAITALITNSQVRAHLPYFRGSVQARIIGWLMERQAVRGIQRFFTLKHMLRKRVNFLYHVLKRAG